MSTYTATIEWRRNGAAFTDNRYGRAHVWRFDGGAVVHASASPHVVPLPLSDPAGVGPEEAFVASLSSLIASSVRTEVLCEPAAP